LPDAILGLGDRRLKGSIDTFLCTCRRRRDKECTCYLQWKAGSKAQRSSQDVGA
jgi:hypothetical protein